MVLVKLERLFQKDYREREAEVLESDKLAPVFIPTIESSKHSLLSVNTFALYCVFLLLMGALLVEAVLCFRDWVLVQDPRAAVMLFLGESPSTFYKRSHM